MFHLEKHLFQALSLMVAIGIVGLSSGCREDGSTTPQLTDNTNAIKHEARQTVSDDSHPTPSVTTAPSEPVVRDSSHRLGTPVSASATAVSPDGNIVVTVNPESDSVTSINASTLEVIAEIPVGDDPRTLSITPDSSKVVVTNHGSGTISIIDLVRNREISQWPAGSQPYGVVNDGTRAFVTAFGSSSVSIIDIGTGRQSNEQIPVEAFPSGLSIAPKTNRLFITHLFTGRITVIALDSLQVETVIATGQDTNLSQFIAISPEETTAYLPQTRSNNTNENLLFDTTVFPVVNVVNLTDLKLAIRKRITLDTADVPVNMPFATVLSPDAKTLYLANAGSNDISIINLQTNRALAHIDVGANPRGIAITPDGSHVFVNNVLDGTLSVIDTQSLSTVLTIQITDIPLSPALLEGKRLFNAASEPALTNDNWISCATCHFDGTMDGRTWAGFPDGPRNTPSLAGVAQTLPMHWSGDFDELQDVEITIETIQFGDGLIEGKAHDSLGIPHSGISANLDALATYLGSITHRPSPLITNIAGIDRGESVFSKLGCQTCHAPPLYTDRKLHDVGTGNPSVEKNIHGHGTRFDTPSLLGLWATSPYLHDGSAATLRAVLEIGGVHGVVQTLDDAALDDLIYFLESLPRNGF